MAVSSLDLDAAVDRYMNVAGRGRCLGFPFLPGVTSNATTGVPTNSVQGFAPGALFINVKASGAGPYIYVNIGSFTSASWQAIDATISGVVVGVGAGYKIARGTNTQVAASDTVVTGLTTVVAATGSWHSAPTVNQLFLNVDIGDQAGTPAAGSILIKTYKPTAVDNVTPTAATDFTDNLKIDWIAVGT